MRIFSCEKNNAKKKKVQEGKKEETEGRISFFLRGESGEEEDREDRGREN